MPALNGKINFSTSNQVDNNFSIKSISNDNKCVEVCFKSDQDQLVRRFIAPVQKFRIHVDQKSQKSRPVLSLDVTDGGLGVSSSNDGSLLIWLTENGQIRRTLNGHIGDVNIAKFFPSGLVVISGADDLRLKVWSAEDGSCPVSLIGHTSGVNDVCIIDKGRNVVSVGRDGACKLFDVGESKCLANIGKFDCVINSCCLSTLSEKNMQLLNIPQREEPLSEREIGTEDKIVACACEDGFLRILSLRARKSIFEFNCENSVNCCCFISETRVACGTQNGFIFVYDLIENKIDSWREMRSSILSMHAFGPNKGFIATTGDGSCFTWNLDNKNSVIEFTGSNFDPVYKVAFNHTHLFTCSRDGFIRKYSLAHLQ